MIDNSTSRMLWKEFKQVQWLAIAAIAAGFLVILLLAQMPSIFYRGNFLVSVVTFPLIFCVASAANSFAGEWEQGTHGMLRTLPIGFGKILFTKLIPILSIGFLIFAFFWLFTTGWPRDFTGDGLGTFISGLMFLLEGIGWGIFWSLRERNVTRTIGKAIACGLIAFLACLTICAVWEGPSTQLKESSIWMISIVRSIVLLGICIQVLIHGKKWYFERSANGPSAIQAERDSPLVSAEIDFAPKTSIEANYELKSLSWENFNTGKDVYAKVGRLIWLQLSVVSWPLFAIFALSMLVAIFLSPSEFSISTLLIGAFSAMLAAITMGAFYRRKEFFNQFSAQPQLFFFASCLVPACLVLIIAIAISTTTAFNVGIESFMQLSGERVLTEFMAPTVFSILAFTLGGLLYGFAAAVTFDGPVKTVGGGVLMAFLAFAWIVWMENVSVNRWISVLPIYVAPILILMTSMRPWMLERKQTAMIRAFHLAPVMFAIVGACAFRAYEIPYVSDRELAEVLPNLRTDPHPRLDAVRASIDEVENARIEFTSQLSSRESWIDELGNPKSRKFISMSNKLIEINQSDGLEILATSVKPADLERRDALWQSSWLILHALLKEKEYQKAIELISECRLDIASDQQLPKKKSPALFQKLVESEKVSDIQLRDMIQLFQRREEDLYGALDYELQRFIAQLGETRLYHYTRNLTGWPIYVQSFFVHLSFWESIRWERRTRKNILVSAKSYLAAKRSFRRSLNSNLASTEANYQGTSQYQVAAMLNSIASFRMTRIQLAIELYRRDHQRAYPSKLHELEGEYLDVVPLDPFTKLPFLYLPNGLPEDLPNLEKFAPGYLDKNNKPAPFIWSMGRLADRLDRNQEWNFFTISKQIEDQEAFPQIMMNTGQMVCLQAPK